MLLKRKGFRGAIKCWYENDASSKGIQMFWLIRRKITHKDNKRNIPLHKAVARPHLEYCIQAWISYHKKIIDTLEIIHSRATKIIPELRDHSYEERQNNMV